MTEEFKQYTDKQLLFLDALMGEAKGNIRKAMDIAGYAKTTKISEVVRSLNKEIIKAAEEMLAMNAPKAAFGIVDVLDYQRDEKKHLFEVCFRDTKNVDWFSWTQLKSEKMRDKALMKKISQRKKIAKAKAVKDRRVGFKKDIGQII